MRLIDIDKKAKSLGIKCTWLFSKKSLIKRIQRKEGNIPCFGNSNNCSQFACCWREDCLK
ncbi:MAG: hypothetical protein FJZ15_06035 [Candidatus Omnitrophica bacterium]|nr:hypothetical protein [Candidatus Omnitrophota bacterium]